MFVQQCFFQYGMDNIDRRGRPVRRSHDPPLFCLDQLFSDLHNFARELVTIDERIFCVRVPSVIVMDIAPADSGRSQSYQHLIRCHDRIRDVLNANFMAAFNCSHSLRSDCVETNNHIWWKFQFMHTFAHFCEGSHKLPF
jgi:hypothetical protein